MAYTLSGRQTETESAEVDAELRLVTDLFYVWVDEMASEDVTDAALQTAVDTFEGAGYQAVQLLGGGEWTPGMDDDPRLHLVYVSGLDTDASFWFWTAQFEPSSRFLGYHRCP